MEEHRRTSPNVEKYQRKYFRLVVARVDKIQQQENSFVEGKNQKITRVNKTPAGGNGEAIGVGKWRSEDEKSLLRTILVAVSCYMSLNMLIKIYSMVNKSDGMEN